MKRTLFILIGLPAMLGLGLMPASALTAAGLQKVMAAGAGVTVIDIRSPIAYGQDHIPGAINIPASLCPLKKLPPLGAVVVYGTGLGNDTIDAAAAALAAKPGLKVQVLDGGYAGWKNSQGLTTRGAGLKREEFNYITYSKLKGIKPAAAILYDLRKPVVLAGSAPAPLTDLNAEFPGIKHARSRVEAVNSAAPSSSVIVLIDNGDGVAEKEARQLKAAGTHNYVILAGGEMILSRHGQAGLQRNAAGGTIVAQKHSASGTAN